MDADELSEPGGVVIPDSLGVAPGLQHRVGLDDFVLQARLPLLPLPGGSDGGEVRDDFLGVLGLAGTGLATVIKNNELSTALCRDLRNEDGLILSAIHHSLECSLGNGEDMRWNLIPPLSHVDLHGSLGVDGESLKGFEQITNNIAVRQMRTVSVNTQYCCHKANNVILYKILYYIILYCLLFLYSLSIPAKLYLKFSCFNKILSKL